jgi:hypothetical protein
MARPRKQPVEQRSARLPTARVTLAELADVERQALTAGLATAEFVRRCVLGREIIARRSRIEDAAIVELIRVGNNLHQMARATNSGHPTVDRRQQMTPPQPGIGTNKPLGAGARRSSKTSANTSINGRTPHASRGSELHADWGVNLRNIV